MFSWLRIHVHSGCKCIFGVFWAQRIYLMAASVVFAFHAQCSDCSSEMTVAFDAPIHRTLRLWTIWTKRRREYRNVLRKKRRCVREFITSATVALHCEWRPARSRTHPDIATSKCYMDVDQVTSGHLFASPMCLVVEHSPPPAQIASWCRQSRPPPSAIEPSRSLPR